MLVQVSQHDKSYFTSSGCSIFMALIGIMLVIIIYLLFMGLSQYGVGDLLNPPKLLTTVPHQEDKIILSHQDLYEANEGNIHTTKNMATFQDGNPAVGRRILDLVGVRFSCLIGD